MGGYFFRKQQISVYLRLHFRRFDLHYKAHGAGKRNSGSRNGSESNRHAELLSTSSPKARIAGFLLYRKERTAERAVKLKLEDIAASVSLRPETVSRKLKELEREGIIQKTGQSSIEIINFSELRSISGL